MDKDRLEVIAGAALATLATVIASAPIVVWSLLGLQVFDYLSGVLAAGATGTADSDVGWLGIRKKALTWLLVAACFVAQHALGNLAPIALVLAGFYCGVELVSIVENAGKAGVPIPPFLRDALAQLQSRTSAPGVEVRKPIRDEPVL